MKTPAKSRPLVPKTHYTLQQEKKASSLTPLPLVDYQYQLKQMWHALVDMEVGEDPTN